jgi:hypothetical protein
MSEAEITDIDLETYDRNIILNEQHSKLPSYCYWDSYSIENESLKERYNWWKTVNTTKYIEIKEKWEKFYQNKVN